MKTIKVSDATYRAIAEAAILPFRSDGTRQPDSSWLFPVVDEPTSGCRRIACRAKPTRT